MLGAIAREEFSYSVATVNVFGLDDLAGVPWQRRYDDLADGLSAEKPDIVPLQEVYADRGGCPGLHTSNSKPLFRILSRLRANTGLNYRIAHANGGWTQNGFCGLRSGTALIYNATRLKNLAPSMPGPRRRYDEDVPGFQLRDTYPCKSGGEEDCTLVDGPTFVGAFWKNGAIVLDPTVFLFEFVKHHGEGSIHLFNLHFHPDTTADFDNLTNTINAVAQRFTETLYPPVLAGDFNIKPPEIRRDVMNSTGTFGRFSVASLAGDEEEEGILVGKQDEFSASFNRYVIERPRALCHRSPSDPSPIWTDHCVIAADFYPNPSP